MRITHTITFLLLGAALVGVGSLALRAGAEPERTPAQRHAESVRQLVCAQPFTLDEAATHYYRAEQPRYDAGWLIVLDVDPAFVVARQTEEPVLYAGAQTLERVNHGSESGRVVCILPSPRGADGQPSLDLAAHIFFFGPEALPERIDALEAQHQLARAARSGTRPFTPDEVAAARACGGEALRVRSRDELDQLAGVLVLEHAPEDVDVGNGMLAPRVPGAAPATKPTAPRVK